MPHPARSKGRKERAPTAQTRHTQQSGGPRRQSAGEVHEQTQKYSHERRDGTRWASTPGTILLPGEREDLFFPPQSYGQWDNELPPLQTNDAGLCKRRNTSTASHHGERSPGPHNDAGPISTTGQGRMHTANGQSQSNPGTSREEQELTTGPATGDNSPGISGFRETSATTNPRPIKQTVETAAQTDNTDNFIVSKDTLVAYTIAVIQQTHDYHFGQMSVVFQTAHNKAALETLSRAEDLAKEHFNIALLTDKIPGNTQSHDETNTSPPTVDPTPTASAQETLPKSVDQGFKHPNSKPPTGTVPPTSRPQAELCDGIPAGYETDDSWGCYSPHARPEEQTPDLEEELLPILTLRA